MTPNHGLKYPKCVLTQKGWFLFISDASGAITTAIFSENAILSKTRFEKKIHTKTSTDYWVKFDEVLAIFHTPQGTQGVWKIAKKPNHLVKFGCGSVTGFFVL